jgi:Lar family restriction alleviation protein
MEIKPCPFCGGTVHTVSTSTAIAGNTLYGVLCVCGAEGPTGDTPDEAAKNWNIRERQAKESEATDGR